MKQVGYALFILSGLILFIAEVVWCYRWWGDAGVLIGIFGGPIITVAFPFMLLLKQGFSAFYFGVWGIGLLGIFIAGSAKKQG
jgi:hypothetical protein